MQNLNSHNENRAYLTELHRQAENNRPPDVVITEESPGLLQRLRGILPRIKRSENEHTDMTRRGHTQPAKRTRVA